MIVGVPHGPSARVTLGFLTVGREDVAAVPIRPLRPRVKTTGYLREYRSLEDFYDLILCLVLSGM